MIIIRARALRGEELNARARARMDDDDDVVMVLVRIDDRRSENADIVLVRSKMRDQEDTVGVIISSHALELRGSQALLSDHVNRVLEYLGS